MIRSVVAFATAVLFPLVAFAQSGLSDSELLQQLDDARFPSPTVSGLRVRIVSETPETTREAEVVVYLAEIEGAPYARIEFLAPAELEGQIYLSTPEATYFYAPDLDFPIRTSASAELFGDAAVAQTSGIRFAEGYSIAEQRAVASENDTDVWEIELVALDDTVAFQFITVVVDPVRLLPLSATLYGLSRFPFYEVHYETYATREEDDVYVSRQRIVNLFLAGRETVSETSAILMDAVPPSWFDPQTLGGSE